VYTGPGAIAFTRTPEGLNSAAQARVIDDLAPFVAPYAAAAGSPIWPAMLLTLMMLPLPFADVGPTRADARRGDTRHAELGHREPTRWLHHDESAVGAGSVVVIIAERRPRCRR
jgi:hypothetical protein